MRRSWCQWKNLNSTFQNILELIDPIKANGRSRRSLWSYGMSNGDNLKSQLWAKLEFMGKSPIFAIFLCGDRPLREKFWTRFILIFWDTAIVSRGKAKRSWIFRHIMYIIPLIRHILGDQRKLIWKNKNHSFHHFRYHGSTAMAVQVNSCKYAV
jgi:hypothetical protein